MSEKRERLTKITRPHCSLSHPRTDLFDLFDVLHMAPLIMVSGPSGTGKASLLASYTLSRDIPCIWYQVDKEDQNLATFFHYLNLAACEVNPFIKQYLPQASPECIAGVTDALKTYFTKFYQCLEPPFLLVLNNYQAIADRALSHRVIREACAALPLGGRIILINSTDNPPAVACLRADGSTAIVGWQEIQLYPARIKEMASELGQDFPLYFSINQLQCRIGDWAAEMVLALRVHEH